MPDNNLEPVFDLGITNNEVVGNLKDAEAFLSENYTKEEDPEELKKASKEDLEKTPKKEPKKEEPKKEDEDPNKLIDDFLGKSEEDEDKEEEKEEEETKSSKSKDEEESDNQFESFSKELYKLNVLTSDEDEDPVFAKSGEDLLNLLNKEKQKGGIQWVERFLEQHGEDRRELFDAIFIKGVDPKEYLPVYNQAEILESLDLTQEKNQEKVVREFYKRSKIPEEKIDARVQRLKDIAELQSEAEDLHPQLLEQDKQAAAELAARAEEQHKNKLAIEAQYQESLVNVVKEKGKGSTLDGIPISGKITNEALDFLITKKWKLADGSLITDFDKFILETKKPENVDKRLKIALLEKIGWDFSKIKLKDKSDQSEELFTHLKKETKKQKPKDPIPSGW